jgi:Family of unknown function (DUF5675)
MILSVKRTHGTQGYTHGKLSIDGEYFCETMEDMERATKVAGATAIPCGNYKVIIDMSTRFKRLMPHILNVPNFEGIRIHSGNTEADTEGCLLVGEPLRDDFITHSRDTFAILFKRMNDALADSDVITIEIS